MAIKFYKELGELGYLATYSNHGFYKDDIFYNYTTAKILCKQY